MDFLRRSSRAHQTPHRTAASLAASVLTVSLAGGALTVAASPAAAADRSGLPLQTQIVGGVWDGVRTVLDVPNPADDQSFYDVPEGADTASLDPGTVLRERTFDYHVATLATPLKVTQILYVTTNPRGVHEQNVTSVVHPPNGSDGNVISYQSIYDSANPADNPSRAIAGNLSLGGLLPTVETAIILPALMNGHPVVIADTEGRDADLAAGPAYGAATLDSLRAATAATTSPVTASDRIGLFGYSGGAIASNWAAIRAADYAPEIEERLIGVAQGGMLIDPQKNLSYAGDGLLWSGVVGLALTALGDAYDVDFSRYLTPYGMTVTEDMRDLSIVESMARYPGLHWSDIAKPEYPTPQDAPEIKAIIDDINMGNWDAPHVPMFVFQGAAGWIEGTPASPTWGPGDGIMVAGDVRTIVRRYCAAGTPIEYREYPFASHVIAAAPWAVEGYLWLEARFNGRPATNNCATVPRGNEL
ncbi:lipase family protein [uncultured Corynebacterium sp.]|uniref:lipase family protein n=1 Tax=uncultured Corynebacterium sp. TaxID=159447 RepID=UPI0025E3451C|nr:lipase family protein [uncultured Corynebacterium sp.]